ncbi:hypothetical protein K493DRAFT_315918 [Basidiobolus meristosporus CBS 931.73]|uniref:BHLH domain-containing protein n=1 Tax=Basidiobolus meristosporus CBS 931.73 TaxID=1314790 RepID=A0A1Y1Y6U1_9FUNG|nr:hypothetical protein K493DRAFT_315918 [Basidiobolus meristosporus CBS 931.73]|eukprot:ORX93605.1 hypothetical protein K493DRAFT_315918 [Basidiobolus meristosporus CBS 931.73]
MTPSHPFSNAFSASLGAEDFTPLTSPALGPSSTRESRTHGSIPNLTLGGSLMQSMAKPSQPRSKSLLIVREDTHNPSKSSAKGKAPISRAIPQRKRPYPERRFSSTPSSLSTSTTVPSDSTSSVVSPITPATLMKLGDEKAPKKSSMLAPLPSPLHLPLTSPSLGPSLMMSPTITAIPTSPALSNTFKSPGLKPLVSPGLKPLLPGGGTNDVAMKLATKSNYQNILEGNTASLGLKYKSEVHSGIELRRTSHKAAEQKRRDSLKQCFENLKSVIPEIEEKAPSKAYLLKKSYDHILRLEMLIKERDDHIHALRKQLQSAGIEPQARIPCERSNNAEDRYLSDPAQSPDAT